VVVFSSPRYYCKAAYSRQTRIETLTRNEGCDPCSIDDVVGRSSNGLTKFSVGIHYFSSSSRNVRCRQIFGYSSPHPSVVTIGLSANHPIWLSLPFDHWLPEDRSRKISSLMGSLVQTLTRNELSHQHILPASISNSQPGQEGTGSLSPASSSLFQSYS
jgi:hypothetical protein